MVTYKTAFIIMQIYEETITRSKRGSVYSGNNRKLHTLESRGSGIHIFARSLSFSQEETCYIYISRQSLVLTLKQLNFLVHEKIIKVHKGFQAGWICHIRRRPAT